jgi:hypothetical protein
MLIFASLMALAPGLITGEEVGVQSTSDFPRKVMVGTAMQALWGAYLGLEQRLEQLSGIIDRMAAESEKRYGRGLEVAVLPGGCDGRSFRRYCCKFGRVSMVRYGTFSPGRRGDIVATSLHRRPHVFAGGQGQEVVFQCGIMINQVNCRPNKVWITRRSPCRKQSILA